MEIIIKTKIHNNFQLFQSNTHKNLETDCLPLIICLHLYYYNTIVFFTER